MASTWSVLRLMARCNTEHSMNGHGINMKPTTPTCPTHGVTVTCGCTHGVTVGCSMLGVHVSLAWLHARSVIVLLHSMNSMMQRGWQHNTNSQHDTTPNNTTPRQRGMTQLSLTWRMPSLASHGSTDQQHKQHSTTVMMPTVNNDDVSRHSSTCCS